MFEYKVRLPTQVYCTGTMVSLITVPSLPRTLSNERLLLKLSIWVSPQHGKPKANQTHGGLAQRAPISQQSYFWSCLL